MPKIQLDIPPHIHKKLKEAAASEARSLTNFITYHIGELADTYRPHDDTNKKGGHLNHVANKD